MKRFFAGMLVVLTALGLAGCAGMSKQDVGVVTGGAAGALLGSQFGSGSGQSLAIAGGAIVGGLIGGSIGRSMDQQDRMIAQRAVATNRDVSWSNPRTRKSYTVKTRGYKKTSRGYCREYVTTATIAGKKQQTYGTACRQPDGTWKVVSTRA